MLNSSYATVQQFQSQISSIQSFQELNKLAKEMEISFSVQISSATVWIAILDLTECLPQHKIETNRDVISRVLGAQVS